ncbi:MAG: hypothetical protein LBU09_04525 [Endomicrobium sp.]|jgi:hypothetical protein|nr:hypothetical protein [Endomicrobium sp.]
MSKKPWFVRKLLGFVDMLAVSTIGQSVISIFKATRTVKSRHNVKVVSFYINAKENKHTGRPTKVAEIGVEAANENDYTLAKDIFNTLCEILPNSESFTSFNIKLIRAGMGLGSNNYSPCKIYSFSGVGKKGG